jgi:hypothetical protein
VRLFYLPNYYCTRAINVNLSLGNCIKVGTGVALLIAGEHCHNVNARSPRKAGENGLNSIGHKEIGEKRKIYSLKERF